MAPIRRLSLDEKLSPVHAWLSTTQNLQNQLLALGWAIKRCLSHRCTLILREGMWPVKLIFLKKEKKMKGDPSNTEHECLSRKKASPDINWQHYTGGVERFPLELFASRSAFTVLVYNPVYPSSPSASDKGLRIHHPRSVSTVRELGSHGPWRT